jgi:putative membrane protein
MKGVIMLGKGLTALFWGVVLANLLQPFAQPFALLLQLLGAGVLLLHGAEYLLFRQRLMGQTKPAVALLQVLVFGIFHLLALANAPTETAAGEGESLGLEAENA